MTQAPQYMTAESLLVVVATLIALGIALSEFVYRYWGWTGE
jgi:hypothetical protein